MSSAPAAALWAIASPLALLAGCGAEPRRCRRVSVAFYGRKMNRLPSHERLSAEMTDGNLPFVVVLAVREEGSAFPCAALV